MYTVSQRDAQNGPYSLKFENPIQQSLKIMEGATNIVGSIPCRAHSRQGESHQPTVRVVMGARAVCGYTDGKRRSVRGLFQYEPLVQAHIVRQQEGCPIVQFRSIATVVQSPRVMVPVGNVALIDR